MRNRAFLQCILPVSLCVLSDWSSWRPGPTLFAILIILHSILYTVHYQLTLNAWRDEIRNKEQGYLMVLFRFWNNAILPFKRENIFTCHWLPSFRGRYEVKGQSQSTFCCVQVRKEITILQRACSTKISTLICRAKWLDIFT